METITNRLDHVEGSMSVIEDKVEELLQSDSKKKSWPQHSRPLGHD
jgi:hypothetical protein